MFGIPSNRRIYVWHMRASVCTWLSQQQRALTQIMSCTYDTCLVTHAGRFPKVTRAARMSIQIRSKTI